MASSTIAEGWTQVRDVQMSEDTALLLNHDSCQNQTRVGWQKSTFMSKEMIYCKFCLKLK